MLSFGPVPSRRLGRSLGINSIPPKNCSYSCIYCQVGSTTTQEIQRRRFFAPEELFDDVRSRVAAAAERGERIDYLTFVPDGEPTLDLGLGESIRLLRSLDIPIAVISNGSLLWQPEVREVLGQADWVSVKVDAVAEDIWRRVDHPNPDLVLPEILDGIRIFAGEFEGRLCTETMLVSRVNDRAPSVRAVAGFLAELDIDIAYLSIPTRPPARPGVRKPDEQALNEAFHLFDARLPRVELLIGYEGDAFASTGDVEADILSISAVHPLRKSAIEVMLAGGPWDVVEGLVANGHLRRVEYQGETYYLRAFVDPQEPAVS